jgi:hypothetical protein
VLIVPAAAEVFLLTVAGLLMRRTRVEDARRNSLLVAGLGANINVLALLGSALVLVGGLGTALLVGLRRSA